MPVIYHVYEKKSHIGDSYLFRLIDAVVRNKSGSK